MVGRGPDEVDVEAEGYCLLVEQPLMAHAQHHLWQYEEERRRRPAPVAAVKPQPGAWRGSVLYCILLLLPPILLAQGWFHIDPYESATLQPALVRAGEWWRALTALTLHWDFQHLLGNLGGGALLGYSAAQVWGSARAWLLTIVRNTAFSWLARQRSSALVMVGDLADIDEASAANTSGGADPQPTPESELIRRADQQMVAAAIAAITLPMRAVLVLRDVNGCSYKEIAEVLNLPIGTVMSRLARGRQHLAALVRRAEQ